MKDWSGWNSRAIIYIRTLSEDIYIEDIVNEYNRKIGIFNNWLVGYLQDENKEKLDELHKINSELLEHCKKEGIPLTEKEWIEYDKKLS